ncbi:MAG: tetratricopeptide repeat protein [Myxococcota bacterium]
MRHRLLLIVAVALAFAPGLRAPFTYDDRVEVVGNRTIRQLAEWEAIAGYNTSRPLLIATYALDWRLWGLEPLGYHLVSLAIHVGNALLVERLARRWVKASWLAAALWALHPMCSEAVTYTTGRSDALCATAWLCALLAWTEGRAAWALVAAAAGLLVKEVAVALPLALFAARAAPPRAWVGLGGLVVAAGALRVATYGWPVPEVDRSALAQAATQGEAWARYLRLWLLPVGQSILHDLPVTTRWGSLAALAVAFVAIAKHPGLPRFAAVLWVAWLLPSSIVPLKETMAEHRAYLAGAALALGVAAWLPRGGWVLVPALFAATLARTWTWADEPRLWADAAAKNPQSRDAAYGHAEALRFAGRMREAADAYRRVLALRPGDPDAQVGLGIALAETGDTPGARAAWLAALRSDPRTCAAHNSLAALDVREGRPTEAIEGYLSTLRACPDDALAHYNLGVLLYDLGRLRDAEGHLREYLRVEPDGRLAEAARERLGRLD